MNPYTQTLAKNNISNILNNIEKMDDTRVAAVLINNYAIENPNDKEYISEVRNELSDITFDVFEATKKSIKIKC